MPLHLRYNLKANHNIERLIHSISRLHLRYNLKANHNIHHIVSDISHLHLRYNLKANHNHLRASTLNLDLHLRYNLKANHNSKSFNVVVKQKNHPFSEVVFHYNQDLASYFPALKRLLTSSQLITLKKAAI